MATNLIPIPVLSLWLRKTQIDLTGIATMSSIAIASFTTYGSPYFTPIRLP